MGTETKVSFPAKTSLGSLYLADRLFPHQRKWIGEAVGEVTSTVPADKMLGIAVSANASPEWIEEGAEQLAGLQSIDLSTSRFSEALLKALTRLDALELRLDFVPFEDAHVQRLSAFSSLTTLWMLMTAISNKGLRPIVQLPALKHLVLKKTEITDGGMVHISEATGLESLLLPGAVSDNGLEELAPLKSLAHLDLANTRVTGNGLKHLKPLLNLQTLYLNDTAIGDQGLDNLAALPKLQTLYLSGTAVSDEGINVLENLQNLSYVELRDSRVTEIGVQRLRSRLPECEILGP